MNVREQGFLLLTSFLGDPERTPLTVAQFRILTKRVQQMDVPENRKMVASDLMALGYDEAFARKVLALLSQQDLLKAYLQRAKEKGCYPLTRLNPQYPKNLRLRLGLDAPGSLWYKGNLRLLDMPAISMVGSRDLSIANAAFAREAGEQAAKQGFALVSGNARGADREAQDACLAAGGKVICIVADALQSHSEKENILYLSETGFQLPFSSARALSRNRLIHSLGEKVLVAQCNLKKGGTWQGTALNLQNQWSPVFCYDDGTEAAYALKDMGATLILGEALQDLQNLSPEYQTFWN